MFWKKKKQIKNSPQNTFLEFKLCESSSTGERLVTSTTGHSSRKFTFEILAWSSAMCSSIQLCNNRSLMPFHTFQNNPLGLLLLIISYVVVRGK